MLARQFSGFGDRNVGKTSQTFDPISPFSILMSLRKRNSTHCFSGRAGLGALRREPKKLEVLSFALMVEGDRFTSSRLDARAGKWEEGSRTLRDAVWLRIEGGPATGGEAVSRTDVLLDMKSA